MTGKKKWLLIPAAIVLVIIILCAMFWQHICVFIAPKVSLTSALTNTAAMLESRFSASPMAILSGALDPNGRNTIDMTVNTTDPLLGTVQYDMTLQIQHAPRRIQAEGEVIAGGKPLDLSVYLDGDFAALSSSGLLGGNFYGLTYDTFPQDIRSNHLLSMMVGEKMLEEWEDNVAALQSFMSKSLEIPDISQIDFGRVLVGILALDADADIERIQVNGKWEEYYVITFETTGAVIASGLEYLNTELPIPLNTGDDVDISFWMKDDLIVKMEVEAGDLELEAYLHSDDLYLQYVNSREMRTLRVKTQQNSTNYQESITVTGNETLRISYNWMPSTGDLSLSVNRGGEESNLSMQIFAAENGFTVKTGDFEALMHLLMGTKDSADSPCTITVTKGAQITTPIYKNFSEWTMEDLITLLSGVGSLFGLKIG